ncbi:patatin family protein [Fusobacterium nucleatum subsp. nucleatum ATCC 23726]|uniref:Serine protease n=2 Tax=Fusobacterium nucleatum subsp. nucleatum TaxID=76856 RepID=A0A0M4T3S8_FUSNC|nr:patatin family protein [Fusobacterium nucleatum]ALF23936.1 serine protease [Fusobacterium nucleatum subsp. nucleatum ChDC F316]ALF24990.1 serine protease [Fusobacterium nucleatum subsp. nucleatum]ASG26727.1 patatin family protein [Fusobacterium nucleatum subsp. nucleatum]AVQ23777.1 patatin family protein [Fusobacterium nucleatum subsp. nucleatum ATCC 23726]EFG94871.1 phospholipase, patatin family [Fusobacterium nucleatum subsp. nucleatum ATCC 23726]
MKVGLVLEGGGMRALFTAGVLDALLDVKELNIDGIVGVSAGALFGVNYVSEQKERAIRYNKKYARDKRYMGFYSWITTGNAVNEDFAFYEIPFKLDVFDQEKFKESKIDFYVVMTNIENGQAEYVLIKDVFEQMEYLRATSALPFASKIIEINGKKYLDGGISDSIPIDYCESLGYDKIILILTRPENNYKDDKLNFLYKLVYRKYPNLVERLINMGKDYEIVLKKIKDLENKNKIFVIRPPKVLKIGRLEKNEDKIQNVYDIGLSAGKKEINNLFEYLNK